MVLIQNPFTGSEKQFCRVLMGPKGGAPIRLVVLFFPKAPHAQ